jgi:hypothetical protein
VTLKFELALIIYLGIALLIAGGFHLAMTDKDRESGMHVVLTVAFSILWPLIPVFTWAMNRSIRKD